VILAWPRSHSFEQRWVSIAGGNVVANIPCRESRVGAADIL
jgi:hypothetical protein